MLFIRLILTINEEKLKPNRKMKLPDLHQKYMLKKEQEMQGMQVKKLQFS